MKRRMTLTILIVLVAPLVVMSVGCKKKTTPAARAPVSRPQPGPDTITTAPAPTVNLTASPSTINRGEEVTLSWNTDNATSVLIDGGVGNVATSGSVRVSPLESVTYTATASGSAGEAKSSARVTVIRGDERVEVSETDVEALQRAIQEGQVRPVFFNYDSAELSREAKDILEENSRWFRRYPNVGISLEGHCDERGTEEYNLALGDQRAQAARSYLIDLGVASRQLQAISFGEERPFVSGSTESAWAKNRRAHFVVR